MPKEKDKVRLKFARGSRGFARNLDDQIERKIIRDTPALQKAIEGGAQLNQFESLVADGEIMLHPLPREARGMSIGEEVWLNDGHRAYDVIMGLSGILVYTTDEREPPGTTYEIVHSGQVDVISFRKPGEKGVFNSTSSIIEFTIMRLTGKKRIFSYHVAFVNPDSVSSPEVV